MESGVKRPRGRPRKRRREDEEDERESGKKRVVVVPKAYVGRYVLKEFKGDGVFLGKVVYYDTGLYRVEYEDGDAEDLEANEVRRVVLDDDRFDGELSRRRKRLDGLVLRNGVKKDGVRKTKGNGKDKVELSTLTEMSGEIVGKDDNGGDGGEDDSSSDVCGVSCDGGLELEVETPLPPPPQLPPSSGTIGVPEDCVLLLFSVHGFLRSFSIQLFLCPFGLNDFVGSLNCRVPNTLLDAIHVSLMRTLRKHLEYLSSEGSEIASRCLRCGDWSLIDNLTWPVFVIQYLKIMGYLRGPQWSGFCGNLVDREYYQLPIGRKLSILQIICDDVLDSSVVRAEIDMREELEVGTDIDATEAIPSDDRPRRVHPRYPKTSACKDQEAMEIITRSQETDARAKCAEGNTNLVSDGDENSDECRLCGMDGTLLCCDGCPFAYHSRCIGVLKMFLPEGPWYCPECTINKVGPPITKGTSLSGAVIFGTDPYGQVFLGTCNHLVVYNAPSNTGSFVRYYNCSDILKVLHILHSSIQSRCFYSEICTKVLQYWSVPKSIFSPSETKEVHKNISNLKENVNDFSSTPFLCGNSNGVNANKDQHNSAVAENSLDNVVVPCTDTCTNKIIQPNISCEQSHVQDFLISGGKLPEQIMMESTLNTGSDSQQQSLAEKNSFLDPGDSDSSFTGQFQCANLAGDMSSQSKDLTAAALAMGDKYLVDSLIYMGTSFKPQAYINNYIHGEFAASAAANLAILSSEETKISEAHASGSSKKASSMILLQSKAFLLAASRFVWPSSEKKLVEVPRERCGWCYSCKAAVQSRRGCMLNNAASNATRSAIKFLPGLLPMLDGEGCVPSIATYILYMEESLSGLVVGPFISARYREKWRNQVRKATTYKALKALLVELEENIRLIALSGDWVKLMDDWFAETSVSRSTTCPIGTTQTRGLGKRRQKKQSSASEVAVDSKDRTFSWWHGGKLLRQIFQRASLPRLMIKRMARHGGWRRITGISYADENDVPRRNRRLVWRAAVDSSRNAAQLALQVRCLDVHVRWNDLFRPEQNFQDGKGQETDPFIFRNAKISAKKSVEDKILYGVAFENQKHLPSRIMKNVIDIEKNQDGEEKLWFSETRIPLYLIKDFEENIDPVPPPQSKNSTSSLSELQRRQLKASRKDIFTYLMCKRDKLDKCYCASCQLDVLLGKAVKCSDCEGYCHSDCTVQSIFSSHEKVKISVICKQCDHVKPRSHSQYLNSNVYLSAPMSAQGEEHPNLATSKHTRPKGCNQPVASVKTQESSSKKIAVSSGPKPGSKSRSNLSWGIIWKKKHDTGIEFRLKNILPKGNPDIHWLRPDCALCQKPYDSDLMYIRCETCKHWYHAEAVELEESKISDVVGFKCCKCRRIKSPICPFEDPESKKRRKKALNQESNPTESDSGMISESKDEATTSMFPAEDSILQDDPLLSLSRGELVKEQTSKADFDWDAGSRPGPQKLVVRRHSKSEVDSTSFSWNELSHADPTVYVDSGGPLNSIESTYSLQAECNAVDGFDSPKKLPVGKFGHHGDSDGSSIREVPNIDNYVLQNDIMMDQTDKPSSPQAGWDASSNALKDEVVYDYENFNYEDMEFEPQTYFSFTELLASEDGEQFDGADDSKDAENSGELASSMVQCKMCSQTEPVPDCFCYLCGLWIHSSCSPWVESSSLEDGWICGNCQERQ